MLWFGTNLVLIKPFVLSGFTSSLVQYDVVWNCLHSREQLWKEVAIKEKSWWLMLMTSPLGQKGPIHHQECVIQTSSDPMLPFRPMRNISEKPHHWLKKLLTSSLSTTPTFPYGLPLKELELPSLWPWRCVHKLGERILLFPSFKITVFTHKIFIFSFTSSPIFKERYGFRFFNNTFYISCRIPLGLCVSIDIYIFEYGCLIFWWNCCVIFSGFAVIHCFACTMRSCNTHTLSLSWL